jgi:ABC-type uncharacterized transport system ATPase subunit
MGLRFCQVSKHFGAIVAVNGVTLEISPRQTVGIIGRFGNPLLYGPCRIAFVILTFLILP